MHTQTPPQRRLTNMALDAKLRELDVLNERKAELEKELQDVLGELHALGTDRTAPLVTADGFPRSDVDVHAARTARVRAIRLENDIKAVYAEVGPLVNEVFRLKQEAAGTRAPRPKRAICKIRSVLPGARGEDAGLKPDDQVLAFGYARVLAGFPAELLRSQRDGVPLAIQVARPGTAEPLDFQVEVRAGQSLGCHFVPL